MRLIIRLVGEVCSQLAYYYKKRHGVQLQNDNLTLDIA